MTRVPVLVVTGFLGSGKTTLLNRILVSGHKRIAVIENEYAVEIGVENELVDARRGATFTEIEEVGGACICHGGLAQFARKLRDLIENRRDKFDVVVVETTGLADPAFAQIFFVDPFLKDAVQLQAICTVVDSRHIEHHLAKPVAEGCVNEALVQITAADIILLNKVDLIKPDKMVKLEKKIRALNPSSSIHVCERCNVPVTALLENQVFTLANHPVFKEGVQHLEETGLQKSHADHDAAVGSLVLAGHGNIENVETLKQWIVSVTDECGDELWRVKGVVALKNDRSKYVLQGVHKILDVRRCADSEWNEDASPIDGGRRCQIVLIGRNLSSRRKLLEESATQAFGFPLRIFNADLTGPDPHAFPTKKLMMFLVLICFSGFFRADGLVEQGGFAQQWAPAIVLPFVETIIAWRWYALVLCMSLYTLVHRFS